MPTSADPAAAKGNGAHTRPDRFRIISPPGAADRLSVTDFFAHMPSHSYIFRPSRELWPAASVDGRLPLVKSGPEHRPIRASRWLDKHRAVEQLTWAPGESELIEGQLIDSSGGWIAQPGCRVFNLYRPPNCEEGEPQRAERWVEHVRALYGEESLHIIRWLAHRVQRPGEKINHALVLGGAQGIGKDTILEPVSYAVGPWNMREASPIALLGRFNPFLKSVILRVSEARDLGDVDRYSLYDHMKVITAAPPDVLRIDEKNRGEYAIPNVTGVIVTTNHKGDGLFLPVDDRRHFVAWSSKSKDDFRTGHFDAMWTWYRAGGMRDVAAYLRSIDIGAFDAKAPPRKTTAFFDIADANRAPEEEDLADVLEALMNPEAVTLPILADQARAMKSDALAVFLEDSVRNGRKIPHRLESAGYVPVRNSDADDGRWKIAGRRRAVYARAELSVRDRIAAARRLVG